VSPLGRGRRTPAADAYRDAPLPGPETPWRAVPFAVVDLETTGLDARRDEIISFASIPVDDGRVRPGGTTTLTIRPERMPAAETIRIHGLRPADLEGAPALSAELDEILDALRGRVLVAHSAWVETSFLSAALQRAGVRLRGPALDTAALTHRVLSDGMAPDAVGPSVSGPKGEPKLSVVARRFGLPVHRPHHAEGDALTAAQLFIALASRLELSSPQTLGSLARLSEQGQSS